MPTKKKKVYAYFIPAGASKAGAKPAAKSVQGVTEDWKATEKMVSGVAGARYRGFDSRAEAEAWLAEGARYEDKAAARETARRALAPGIYFDAGTGRGQGVEISVTDERGKNLLHKAISKAELNKFGKHLIDNAEATNNYGELLALKYALTVARKTKTKKIFGDSRLVIDYWSQWRIKRKDLPPETVALATEVAKLREQFESDGGAIVRISGDYNPADLGFHR